MAEKYYVCPYCGKEIGKDEVLFWETVRTQYTDNIRGEFLRKHGVSVNAGNRFPRMYYKVRRDVNVTRVDENDFPTMLEDHLGNAISPEELNRQENARESSFEEGFGDDFDSEGFGESAERQNERSDRELHNIPDRACPHCHCELPKQFGLLKTYHIALFGGRAAGKTAYLVNLFQQLNTQLSNNNLGSMVLAEESENFILPMIEDYEREGTTHPTPADAGLLPILCHYKNKGDEAFVALYDIAGEGTDNAAYMANHKGIAQCESLLLMIDPNMFVAGAFYDEWLANHGTGENRYAGADDCCKQPLDRFLNTAGDLCHEYAEGIKNVVCVITKLDMMLEADRKFFSSGDIELLNDVGEKHRDAVTLEVLTRVQGDLNRYLEAQYKIRLKEKLQNAFGKEIRVNVLGVSTSTCAREKNKADFHFRPDSAAVAPKHRIIEPFLVVLMYFGLVPARMPDGSIKYFHDKEEMPEQPPEPPKPVKKKKGLFGWWRKDK